MLTVLSSPLKGKTIHKAYKFRFYPNQEQQDYLTHTFGCARFVYNYFLALKEAAYRAWTCPSCGAKHDRDINAAINLYQVAFDPLNAKSIKRMPLSKDNGVMKMPSSEDEGFKRPKLS